MGDERRTALDRLLDVFVYVPTGLFLTASEEFPRLAARGRERLGAHVTSAHSVGRVVVSMGESQIRRRLGATAPAPATSPRARPAPVPPRRAGSGEAGNGHVPEVASLAIPGFDTLSASQVVQRLDGLSRSELVAVRAYETSNRGRRTILNRVDQLLEERS